MSLVGDQKLQRQQSAQPALSSFVPGGPRRDLCMKTRRIF